MGKKTVISSTELTLARFNKDSQDLKTIKVAIPVNVVDSKYFETQLQTCVSYFEYHSLLKSITDKTQTKDKALTSGKQDRVEELKEDIATLNAIKTKYVELFPNVTGLKLEELLTDSFTTLCAWLITGSKAFKPNRDGKLTSVSIDIVNYYNNSFDTDTDHSNERATLKTHIIDYVNMYLKTSNDSKVYKSYTVDRLTNEQIKTIVSQVATTMKWTKQGIISAKVDTVKLAQALFMVVLSEKLSFTETGASVIIF